MLTQIVYTSQFVCRGMLAWSVQAANSAAGNEQWRVKYFMHDLSKQRGKTIEEC